MERHGENAVAVYDIRSSDVRKHEDFQRTYEHPHSDAERYEW